MNMRFLGVYSLAFATYGFTSVGNHLATGTLPQTTPTAKDNLSEVQSEESATLPGFFQRFERILQGIAANQATILEKVDSLENQIMPFLNDIASYQKSSNDLNLALKEGIRSLNQRISLNMRLLLNVSEDLFVAQNPMTTRQQMSTAPSHSQNQNPQTMMDLLRLIYDSQQQLLRIQSNSMTHRDAYPENQGDTLLDAMLSSSFNS